MKPITKNKQWKMFHGSGIEFEKSIETEGLKSSWSRPLFLTPSIEVAEHYAKTKIGYKHIGDEKKRSGCIYQINLTEKDFKDQIKQGSDKRIVKMRKDNLEKVVNEKGLEYLWYYNIPPNRIKKLKCFK